MHDRDEQNDPSDERFAPGCIARFASRWSGCIASAFHRRFASVRMSRIATVSMRRSESGLLALTAAILPLVVAVGGCRTEPPPPPAGTVKIIAEAPRLEKRTKFDPQSGKLIREWSVLVYRDRPAQKHGVETVYYSTGSKQWSREFDHGQPKGVWRSWYQDGAPRSECFFGDPAVDTTMTWWYPGGHIQSRGPARNGVHRGLWRFYYKNGQLAEEGSFFDNQRSGEWRAWSDDGAVVTLRKYVKGVRVSEKPDPNPPAPPDPTTAREASASSTETLRAPAPTPSPAPTVDPSAHDDERPPK
jgi:hypothetical protein